MKASASPSIQGHGDGVGTLQQGEVAEEEDDTLVKDKQGKYKKHPAAPKRFRSAFIIFSQQKHGEIRSELLQTGVETNTIDIARLVSDKWKSLTPEAKEEWEEKARQDKLRYMQEKEDYDGPWKVQANRKKQNDPSAPKKPTPAYFSFSNERRQRVKKQNPTASNGEISKILSRMWKEASEEVRSVYVEKEKIERERYGKELAEWKKRKRELITEEEWRASAQSPSKKKGKFLVPEGELEGRVQGLTAPTSTMPQAHLLGMTGRLGQTPAHFLDGTQQLERLGNLPGAARVTQNDHDNANANLQTEEAIRGRNSFLAALPHGAPGDAGSTAANDLLSRLLQASSTGTLQSQGAGYGRLLNGATGGTTEQGLSPEAGMFASGLLAQNQYSAPSSGTPAEVLQQIIAAGGKPGGSELSALLLQQGLASQGLTSLPLQNANLQSLLLNGGGAHGNLALQQLLAANAAQHQGMPDLSNGLAQVTGGRAFPQSSLRPDVLEGSINGENQLNNEFISALQARDPSILGNNSGRGVSGSPQHLAVQAQQQLGDLHALEQHRQMRLLEAAMLRHGAAGPGAMNLQPQEQSIGSYLSSIVQDNRRGSSPAANFPELQRVVSETLQQRTGGMSTTASPSALQTGEEQKATSSQGAGARAVEETS